MLTLTDKMNHCSYLLFTCTFLPLQIFLLSGQSSTTAVGIGSTNHRNTYIGTTLLYSEKTFLLVSSLSISIISQHSSTRSSTGRKIEIGWTMKEQNTLHCRWAMVRGRGQEIHALHRAYGRFVTSRRTSWSYFFSVHIKTWPKRCEREGNSIRV